MLAEGSLLIFPAQLSSSSSRPLDQVQGKLVSEVKRAFKMVSNLYFWLGLVLWLGGDVDGWGGWGVLATGRWAPSSWPPVNPHYSNTHHIIPHHTPYHPPPHTISYTTTHHTLYNVYTTTPPYIALQHMPTFWSSAVNRNINVRGTIIKVTLQNQKLHTVRRCQNCRLFNTKLYSMVLEWSSN